MLPTQRGNFVHSIWISMRQRCNKNGTATTMKQQSEAQLTSPSRQTVNVSLGASGTGMKSRYIVTNDSNWMHSCANEKSKWNSNLAINWIGNSARGAFVRKCQRFTVVHSFTRAEYSPGDERKNVTSDLQRDTSSNEKSKQIILRFVSAQHHLKAIHKIDSLRSKVISFHSRS